MLKNIKNYSIVALATFIIIGCGSNDSGTKMNSKNISNYSDAEKLAYAIVNQKKALSAGQNKKKKKKGRSLTPCTNGGKMGFEGIDFSQYLPTGPTTVVFENCKDGHGFTNGSMKVDLDDNEEGTITYLSDFTYKDASDEVFIKEGGRVNMHHEDGWEVATINMTAVMNGVTHGGENLIYRSKDLPDGGYVEYPVSGKEKIGDSTYFTVDPNYDASKTPFKSNANDELLSGLFKYVDAKDHAVELEITAKDVVTVRVDEDGDGSFSKNEKSSISL